jgi:hypothetical protein
MKPDFDSIRTHLSYAHAVAHDDSALGHGVSALIEGVGTWAVGTTP